MRDLRFSQICLALHDVFREKPSSLLMLSGWSSVSVTFRMDTFHMCGFLGQNTGVMELVVVTEVYTVLNGTPSLSSVDLKTLAGDAIYTRCF
jgi:hypothetical protein